MAADYTLSVEINGDASSMEKAFKKVSGALEDTKNKINEASSGAVPGIGQMAKSFGIAQLAVKGFSMAFRRYWNKWDIRVKKQKPLLKAYPMVFKDFLRH